MSKTILITGAGTGIGRDAAFALAARGHKVIATTFNDAQAEGLRGQCAAQGVTMEVFALDITDAGQRERIRPLALQINNFAVGFPVTLSLGPLGLVLTLLALQQPITMALQRLLEQFG